MLVALKNVPNIFYEYIINCHNVGNWTVSKKKRKRRLLPELLVVSHFAMKYLQNQKSA